MGAFQTQGSRFSCIEAFSAFSRKGFWFIGVAGLAALILK
jgi:hypothetical protein